MEEIRLARRANEIHTGIQKGLDNLDDEKAVSVMIGGINEFLADPLLLDTHLQKYIETVTKKYLEALHSGDEQSIEVLSAIFYNFGNVASIKKVVLYLSTDVYLIPTIQQRLTSASETKTWNEQYLLIGWLSALVMAPFKLENDVELYELASGYLSNAVLKPTAARLLCNLFQKNNELFYNKFLVEKNSNVDLVTLKYSLKALDIRSESLSDILELVSQHADDSNLVKIYPKLVKKIIEVEDYDRLEDIVAYYFDQLGNPSNDFRFSLAKNFAKIVALLESEELVETILNDTTEILEQPFDLIDSDILHSYLLIIAELTRLRLMTNLSVVMKILSKTFYFQQVRIAYIQGSNIRDASNFVAWSLAKYYKHLDIAFDLFQNLLFVTCFDRELIIRRSSNAAMQELLGRHQILDNIQTMGMIELDIGHLAKSFETNPFKIISLVPNLSERVIEFFINSVNDNQDLDIVKLSCGVLSSLTFDHSKLIVKDEYRLMFLLSCLNVVSKDRDLLETKRITKLEVFPNVSYMHYLLCMLKHNYQPTQKVLENVFYIIRANNEEIESIYVQCCQLLTLDGEFLSKFLLYVRNNNINCCAAIAAVRNEIDYQAVLIEKSISCQSKASVIKSVSTYSEKVHPELIQFLDDYTITEQGDVGRLVRTATMDLISNHLEQYREHIKEIEPRLLRISVEGINSLRAQALSLLCAIKGIDIECGESDKLDDYALAIKVYHECYHSNTEFWRGYVFSAGALHGTDSTIKASINAFLRYYDTLNAEEKNQLLRILVLNLAEDKVKGSRLVTCGMNFLVRLTECNIQIPEEFNFKGFYARIFNLHLKTTNIDRLKCAIGIFEYLAINKLVPDAKKRLCVLACSHPIATVRQAAGESLWQVYQETHPGSPVLELLQSIDFQGDDLKKYMQDIDI